MEVFRNVLPFSLEYSNTAVFCIMYMREGSNIITTNMALADDFTDIEPADNFNGNEGVDPCLANAQLLPLATSDAANQITETAKDLRNISRSGWVEFRSSKSVKFTELGLGSCK